ncbi:hypothetical protein HMPREF1980_00929 [Actinomyces sp. oral taxon 172 str. F0311]|nr:hypothetical protein HMPREF1980_00929 [Actinomyces sp. oral taxon 172 str. F0311]
MSSACRTSNGAIPPFAGGESATEGYGRPTDTFSHAISLSTFHILK